MKRIAKNMSEQLPPVRLYREDVEGLYQAFSDVADTVAISDGNYVYSDLAELFTRTPSELKTFRIASDEPGVSFSIEDGRPPSLHARNDDPMSRGLFHRVREISMRRRLRFSAWLKGSPSSVIVSLSAVVVVVAASLLALSAFAGNVLVLIVGMVAMLIAFGGFEVLAWYAIQGKPCRVFLVTRQQRPGFLTRNRDALVVGSATAVAGAVVGALLALVVAGLLH